MQENCNLELPVIKKKKSENSWSSLKIGVNNSPNEYLLNSAVLVPLIVYHVEVSLLFTLRSNSLDRHSGQVSFPGGIIEKDDNSSIETALRETREEIGVGRENIQVIGKLAPFNTATGYIVNPVVGVIDSLENIRRNEVEVERVFCIPLNWLCVQDHSRMEDFIANDGKTRKVRFFDLYEGELLWGITAKITRDLLEIIKK